MILESISEPFITRHNGMYHMKCSISECKEKSIKTVYIGFKEKRHLCKKHYLLFQNRKEEHVPKFTKASEI